MRVCPRCNWTVPQKVDTLMSTFLKQKTLRICEGSFINAATRHFPKSADKNIWIRINLAGAGSVLCQTPMLIVPADFEKQLDLIAFPKSPNKAIMLFSGGIETALIAQWAILKFIILKKTCQEIGKFWQGFFFWAYVREVCLLDNLVYQSIFDCLLRTHKIITISVFFYFIKCLSRVFS